MARFNIVLLAPEIPGNTGSVGRTCVALDLKLHLIRPYGFDISEKALRRAGLDYWKYVELAEYDSFDEFLKKTTPEAAKMFFFSKAANQLYFDAKLEDGCFLIFGSETKGLPDYLFDKYKDRFYKLPIFSDKVRSLNLSNVVTAVAYEALRQQLFKTV